MRICVTGGTGSLGRALVRRLVREDRAERIVVLSRDEVKQAEMAAEYAEPHPIRWFLGDVRDRARLTHALHGVDTVVHAAALKRVDAIAYNPSEVRRTNVEGSANVLDAAIEAGVGRVVVISSDKAVAPTNAYGVSKAQMEHEAIASNAYAWPRGTRISAVRYGNVIGSRGSVVHLFRACRDRGTPVPLTDPACTRFWITLEQAVDLVLGTLATMEGGEIVVPVLPSMRITDLAEAIAPGHPTKTIGLRPGGEKLHETLINDEEIRRTTARAGRYIIAPACHPWRAEPPAIWEGEPLPPEMVYRSDLNGWWMGIDEMRSIVAAL